MATCRYYQILGGEVGKKLEGRHELSDHPIVVGVCPVQSVEIKHLRKENDLFLFLAVKYSRVPKNL
jgi:hypothetical protein